MKLVALAVVDGDVVSEDLRAGIRAAGCKIEASDWGGEVLPNISLDDAWEKRVRKPVCRMASSRRRAPEPATSTVYSGIAKLTFTWLWAPRLYTSSGRMS